MDFDPNEDKEFWFLRDGELLPVIGNWHEARRRGLNSKCESCGAVYARPGGGHPRYCPNCGSDYTERLEDVWDDLPDPWTNPENDDSDPDDIEAGRITNY